MPTIMDTLITDRTQADVDRVIELKQKVHDETITPEEYQEYFSGLRGAYNAADMNRVAMAAAYVKARCDEMGVDVPGYAPLTTEWRSGTDANRPTPEQGERYLATLRALRRAAGAPTPLPGSLDALTVDGANNIERMLSEAGRLVESVPANQIKCGTAACGQNPMLRVGQFNPSAQKPSPNLTILSGSSWSGVVGDQTISAIEREGNGALSAGSTKPGVATAEILQADGEKLRITALAAGSCTVVVRVSESDQYAAQAIAVAVTVSANAGKQSPNLSVATRTPEAYLNNSIGIGVSQDGDGALYASSSNPSIATAEIIGGMVAISGVALGSCTVTVGVAETEAYTAESAVIEVNITQKAPASLRLSASEITAAPYTYAYVYINSLNGGGEVSVRSSDTSVVPEIMTTTGGMPIIRLMCLSEGSAVVTVSVPETWTTEAESATVTVTITS